MSDVSRYSRRGRYIVMPAGAQGRSRLSMVTEAAAVVAFAFFLSLLSTFLSLLTFSSFLL